MRSAVWRSILAFELRHQLRQPLFYLVTFLQSVLLFLAGTGTASSGAAGRLHLNAPAVIVEQLSGSMLLASVLTTFLVTSAAVRDFDRRTWELFQSKPVARLDHMTARFAGAMLLAMLSCLIAAASLAAGSLMPWVDPARLGQFRLAPFAFGLGIMIYPTIVALGGALFALASATRSSLATYVGAILCLSLSAAASLLASDFAPQWLASLVDPTGMAALGDMLRYWTTGELNAAVPGLSWPLLWNRLLWLGLGMAALTYAVAALDPARPLLEGRAAGGGETEAPPPLLGTMRAAPPIRQDFSARTSFRQFARRVRHETRIIFGGFPFLAALLFGLFVLIQAAASAGDIFGMPSWPRTYLMVEAMQDGYLILLLLLVLLYSGELVWRDRANGTHEILDVMPVGNNIYIAAKLTALFALVLFWLLCGTGALAVFQLASGYRDLEPGLYARGAALAAIYPLLMAVLGFALHVVARGRLVGYGLVIAFVLLWDLLEEFGFEHHLHRYASLPPIAYSEFSGYAPFGTAFGAYSLYWACFALVLIGISTLLWPRGTNISWRTRFAQARRLRAGLAGALIGLGATGFIAAGAFIFYNTNLLNAYVPSTTALHHKAAYERAYRQYRTRELPRIVAVRASVDILPEQGKAEIRGTYRLVNRSARPLRQVHVSMPERATLLGIDLPPHETILEDRELGYRIYDLRDPLAPGEGIDLGFTVAIGGPGFVNHGADILVVPDGSFFTKRDAFPVIGYDAHREVRDPEERRRQGLPPASLAPAGDRFGQANTPRAPDADRIDFDLTLSTQSDQIAVTSGALLRQWSAGGRRFFRYRAERPITHHFAIASARYAVTRRMWNGVAIEIYHHPRHGANVARMIEATRASLAYLGTNFGPYQHPYIRIVETPRYERDATSFPGMIAMSESLGFHARLTGEEAIDYPFHVTAHEVSHQWWGQQLVGADVQGTGILHESLAQYSALMVTEQMSGRDGLRPVLAFELEQYLKGRAGERGEEPPLARAERQDYVYYHKGTLALYALRDELGQGALNAALAAYLRRASVTRPPYSNVLELITELRRGASAGSQQLIDDLFTRMIMYRASIVSASYRRRADGRFTVRVEVDVRKLRVDGGQERDIPVHDNIDLAVLGDGPVAERAPIIARQTRRIREKRTAFEFIVDRRPQWVVVDPLYKLLDRNRADNIRRPDPA